MNDLITPTVVVDKSTKVTRPLDSYTHYMRSKYRYQHDPLYRFIVDDVRRMRAA